MLDSMVTLPYHKGRMQDGSAPRWRQILDRHHIALVDDLTAQLDRELESAASAERERASNEASRERETLTNEATRERELLKNQAAQERERISDEAARERELLEARFTQTLSAERTRAAEESRLRLSESLNQTLRRIRHTTAEHETLQLLLEDSPADRALVLLIENNQARLAAWRNVQLREEDEDRPVDLADAAALASCVETRDPVVALAAPAEISSLLSSAFASKLATAPGAAAAKAYLFPITVRQTTVAVMLASGDVTPAPIELLCEAVGMKLESLDVALSFSAPQKAVAAPAPLVNIAGAHAHSEKPKPPEDATTWSRLTPEEQALHLRAQRFARVRTAQFRISESDGLRKGTLQSDIYSALRPSIDAARDEYERTFMAHSPTMVDYLHLEIVRSLAHENIRLMGQNYPGPIESYANYNA